MFRQIYNYWQMEQKLRWLLTKIVELLIDMVFQDDSFRCLIQFDFVECSLDKQMHRY